MNQRGSGRRCKEPDGRARAETLFCETNCYDLEVKTYLFRYGLNFFKDLIFAKSRMGILVSYKKKAELSLLWASAFSSVKWRILGMDGLILFKGFLMLFIIFILWHSIDKEVRETNSLDTK